MMTEMKTISEFKLPEPVRLPERRREAALRPARRRQGGRKVIDIRSTLERYQRYYADHPDRRVSRPAVIRPGRQILEGIALLEEAEETMAAPVSPLRICLTRADELGARFDLTDWLEEAGRRGVAGE